MPVWCEPALVPTGRKWVWGTEGRAHGKTGRGVVLIL